MISNRLMRLAEQNQWKINQKEGLIFGEYNGYLFTVLEGNNFTAFITPVAGISRQALDQIHDFLTSQHKHLQLYNYDVNDNFLCVRIASRLIPLSPARIESFLGQLSGLLSLYEVPADACIICGEAASRKGLYLGLFCSLHKECEGQEMVDFTADANEAKDLQPASLEAQDE